MFECVLLVTEEEEIDVGIVTGEDTKTVLHAPAGRDRTEPDAAFATETDEKGNF